MATYQDRWSGGRLRASGYRECAERYEVVRRWCATTFSKPFTVCDIGANEGYFGIRLCEDFPDCTVVAFEFDRFEQRAARVRAANATRMLYCRRKLSLADVHIASAVARFDLVLALSVLHHMAEPQDAWVRALRALGRNVILELAVSDSRAAPSRASCTLPSGGTLLGAGSSHLKRQHRRPILHLPGGA